MKAAKLVDTLLEADPDEVDPKQELLRVDPAADIKEIIRGLQNEGILVISYNRQAGIVKMLIKLNEWTTDEMVERWLHTLFQQRLELEIDRDAITASNQGAGFHGTVFEVMFPLAGTTIPLTKLA